MSGGRFAGFARRAADRAASAPRHDARSSRSGEPPAPLPEDAAPRSPAPGIGGGRPLASDFRAEMEARFGVDFGSVRIHDEPAAHRSAQQQRAAAFTLGEHIAFNRSRYAPETRAGRQLLAHELAHVVQQRRGGPSTPAAQQATLEPAADQAASAVVGGTGAVSVAGASAVGIARQPLAGLLQPPPLPVPRSLENSLAKDERALGDVELNREIGRIENWLITQQWAPDPHHLQSELELLYAERKARRQRQAAQAPKPVRHAEGTVGALTDIVHDGAVDVDEVAEAHRRYLATGTIPQTDRPHAPIEIRRGVAMSRARRYDAMMLRQGKPYAQIEDVTVDNRDPDYLNAEEFHDEFFARVHAEQAECDSRLKGREKKCLRAIDDKYGGPAFKSWRDNSEWQMYLRIQEAAEKIEGVVNSGPVSMLGRVAGYTAGSLSGHDPLRWSEYGGDIGGWGDMGLALYGARSERARFRRYDAGGGFELRRDEEIVWTSPSSTGPGAEGETFSDRSAPADGFAGPSSKAEPVADTGSKATTTAGAGETKFVGPGSTGELRTGPAEPSPTGPAAGPANVATSSSATGPAAPAGSGRTTRAGVKLPVSDGLVDDAIARIDAADNPFDSGFGARSKRKMQRGVDGVGQRALRPHIDEKLPVGDRNVGLSGRYERATDPHNHHLFDPATNSQTKHLGISGELIDRGRAPVLPPVSLTTPGVDPSVVLTRSFAEVHELAMVFEQARARIVDERKYSPGALKEKINGYVHDIIRDGASNEGRVVRDALRRVGYEYLPGQGLSAVRSRAAGQRPPPAMEVDR